MKTMETIEFYGATLFVARDQYGNGWVAIKPICDAIGIAYRRQQRKLEGDTRFNCGHMASVAEDGKQREMTCIPISKLNSWLYNVNANKVKPEVRDNLERYQQECQDVLFRHFMPQGGTNAELHNLIKEVSGVSTRTQVLENDVETIKEELSELRYTLSVVMSDTDGLEIRALIAQVKEKTGMDGRSIVGHVRGTLGTSGIYRTPDLEIVKRVLQNMLGYGEKVVIWEPGATNP